MFHHYYPTGDLNMNEEDIIYLCTSISHYADKPLSLLSAIYQEEDGNQVLSFLKARDYNFDGKNKFILITDSTISSEYDFHFKANDFHEALQAYNELKSNDLIIVDETLLRYDIHQNIQPNGVGDNGKIRYEIDGLSNGNIAILATCLYYMTYQKNKKGIEVCSMMVEATQSLYSFEAGTIITI